jgi:hypothetical protein
VTGPPDSGGTRFVFPLVFVVDGVVRGEEGEPGAQGVVPRGGGGGGGGNGMSGALVQDEDEDGLASTCRSSMTPSSPSRCLPFDFFLRPDWFGPFNRRRNSTC